MNRKSLFSCAALLLTFSFLTACAGTSQKIIFSSNWQADNTVQQNELTEILEYDVTFEKASPISDDYSLHYANGKYTTTLTTERFEGRTIYAYETKLEIDAVYQFGSETQQLPDSVYSLVKFEKADKTLRPISSHKEVMSHSPANGADSLEKCYELYHYSVDITYNEDYSGEAVLKDMEKAEKEFTDSFKVNTEKYTCLDNEQLLFALRGINPSLSSTAKFNVYSPYVKATQSIKATFAAEAGMDFSFTRNGATIKETIQYYPVKVVLNEQNPGATQTVWIAKNTDIQSNTHRNVVLRLETPLSYNLGSLIYTLKSATFSN